MGICKKLKRFFRIKTGKNAKQKRLQASHRRLQAKTETMEQLMGSMQRMMDANQEILEIKIDNVFNAIEEMMQKRFNRILSEIKEDVRNREISRRPVAPKRHKIRMRDDSYLRMKYIVPWENSQEAKSRSAELRRQQQEESRERQSMEYLFRDDQELEKRVEQKQITVCIRKRALTKKEVARDDVDVITIPSKEKVTVKEEKTKVDQTTYSENHHFRFDYAFDESCNNEFVYKYAVKPLIEYIFEGGMATCFVYGHIGSGKIRTMGVKRKGGEKGIYNFTAEDIFMYLESPKYKDLLLYASFYEIYCGEVFDLLRNKVKLVMLEDRRRQVRVLGLTEKYVYSLDDLLALIQHGNSARTSRKSSGNTNSSRSHAVFQTVLRSNVTGSIYGKLSLVDLAGYDTGTDKSSALNKQTRKERADINRSLLALKECIRAVSLKSSHPPFRDSKLTQILRNSFIEKNSKMCLIATISPAMSTCRSTLNTLRYAEQLMLEEEVIESEF
jgi:kinesin family protein 2/24